MLVLALDIYQGIHCSVQLHPDSSAANCPLSCTLSVQTGLPYQLNMLLELLAFSFATYLPRCTLSAPLCSYQLNSNLFVRLQCVNLAVRCQLWCNMSAQLPLVHFHVGSVQLVSLMQL